MADSSRSSDASFGDGRSRVLQATDIVQLISQTVALKRAGRNYIGLCPFHQEKTPSFNVNPAKQYFRCFGCKASGTAFDFVMLRDRVEFIDALKTLAAAANIELPRHGVSKEKASEKQQMLEANSAACSAFEKYLADPQLGSGAREYLEKRGFEASAIQAFQIGLVPDGWDNLIRHPQMRKYSPAFLATAGLAKARDTGDGFYDVFRSRLIFPIRDENSRVIAFGGRKMREEDNPKYLNSPETPLFSKSRCVFGLDLARKRIVETRTVAIVEGYTDVVMAHQYGCTNVVATLGTAMTEQHLSVLRRFADRIVLLFDADAAGDTAVDRAVELFLTHPVEIAIAAMPDGLDPDEFLMKFGADAFDALLANAADALTYKWKQVMSRLKDNEGLTAQQEAVENYFAPIAAATKSGKVDSIRWGAIRLRMEKHTGLTAQEINQRFRNEQTKPKFGQPRTPAEVAADDSAAPVRRKGPANAQDRAEQWILGILLNEPNRWQAVQEHVKLGDFADADRRELAVRLWDHQRHEGETVLNEFLGFLDRPELVELAIDLSQQAEQLTEIDQTLKDATEHLKRAQNKLEERQIVADLRRSPDQPGEKVDEVDLLRQLQERARKPDLKRV